MWRWAWKAASDGDGAVFLRHTTSRLQCAKEVHQRRLIPPTPGDPFGIRHIAFRQSFGLGLEVDLGVDVRGLQRHMTEPAPDCVDVDTRAQEMSCAGVADGMGADAFRRH